MQEVRVCTKCKTEKPIGEFYAREASRKCKRNWCKDCAISHIAKKSGYEPFAKINDIEAYCLVLKRT